MPPAPDSRGHLQPKPSGSGAQEASRLAWCKRHRYCDGDGPRCRLLPKGQPVLAHNHHRLLHLLHGNAGKRQARVTQSHWPARAKPGKPARPALPAWTRVGSRSCPTTQCLGLSRWWWRSRRPAGTPLHTSVQPDPGPRWSPSWGWATSR